MFSSVAFARDSRKAPIGFNSIKLGPFQFKAGNRRLLTVPQVILFKSEENWWGSEEPIFQTAGVSYDRFPTSYLSDPTWVTAGYKVAWVPSNGVGTHSITLQQNDPAALKNMYDFAKAGGFLVVDMGDNDLSGSYIAPGPDGSPVGKPDDKFWTVAPCGKFGKITPAGVGHPIFNGIDPSVDNTFCWTNHGNLVDGPYALPATAKVLWTQTFDDGDKPIVAEYDVGSGHVFIDTVTKEFWMPNSPQVNKGLLNNILNYALSWSPSNPVDCTVTVDKINCGTPVSLKASIQTGSKYTPLSYTASVSLPVGCPVVSPTVVGLTLCEKCDSTVPKVQTSYNCHVTPVGNLFNISKTTPGAYVSWKVNAGGVTKTCGVCTYKTGGSKVVCQSPWTPGAHPTCPDNIVVP
jgi:hypothetical protein